jgi:hypothetical protein
MKYISLMNSMRAGDSGMAKWPKKSQQAHLAYWRNLRTPIIA